MRLILFLASAITAGAVGVTQGVIPLPAQMMQAVFAPGGDPAHFRTGAVAYNRMLPQIIRGTHPEDSGLHGAEVAFSSRSARSTNAGPVNVGAIGQSGLASSAVSLIQQNNTRIRDMVTFARDPSDWHDAPPH